MVKNSIKNTSLGTNQLFWFFDLNTRILNTQNLVVTKHFKLDKCLVMEFGRVSLSNVLQVLVGLVRQNASITLFSLLLNKISQNMPLRWEFRTTIESNVLGSFDLLNSTVYRLVRNSKNIWFLNLDYFIGMTMSEYRGERCSYLNTYVLKSSQLKHQFLINAEYVIEIETVERMEQQRMEQLEELEELEKKEEKEEIKKLKEIELKLKEIEFKKECEEIDRFKNRKMGIILKDYFQQSAEQKEKFLMPMANDIIREFYGEEEKYEDETFYEDYLNHFYKNMVADILEEEETLGTPFFFV